MAMKVNQMTLEDAQFIERAKKLKRHYGKLHPYFLQREFHIGYLRAVRIWEGVYGVKFD